MALLHHQHSLAQERCKYVIQPDQKGKDLLLSDYFG
jgi:hypothetical protein